MDAAEESGQPGAPEQPAAAEPAGGTAPAARRSTAETERLARWLDEQGLPGAGEPLTTAPLTGGSQNELLRVTRGDATFVIRRPPRSASADRLRQFWREARLLGALRGTDVPHAGLLAASEDTDLMGVPFYVMEAVDGWCPIDAGWQPPFDTDLAARGGLATELVDGIARLSRVDWKAGGLEGFGRPENFHERQVDRWLSHLSTYQFRELPGLREAADWLRHNQPRGYRPGIMHGDYQFANVMYRHGAPARLAAIIDWEMTTIGDPLLDLGWALMSWPPEGDDMKYGRYLDLGGMPPRDSLLAHYEKVSGRSTEDIDYYIVLARWKLAIVLEASVARLEAGTKVDPKVSTFVPLVPELISKAAELAARTSIG